MDKHNKESFNQSFSIIKKSFLSIIPFLWIDRSSVKILGSVLLLSLLDIIIFTASPLFLGYLIKSYNSVSPGYLLLMVLSLSFIWFCEKNIKYLRNIIFFKLVNRAIKDIRYNMVVHLHEVPLDQWISYSTPEILSATARVSSAIRNFLKLSILNVFISVLKVITISVAMVSVLKISYFFVIGCFLTYILFFIDVKKYIIHRNHIWESSDKVMKAISDSLANTKIFRYYLGDEKKKLDKLFSIESKSWFDNYKYENFIHINQSLLFFLIAGGFIFYLFSTLSGNKLSISEFMIIKGYMFKFYNRIYDISNGIRGLLASSFDIRKVTDLLSLSSDKYARRLDTLMVNDNSKIVELKNVSFFYGSRKILDNVCIDINKGDRVAIIGSSGAGKSTLCSIISGLYKPILGNVFLYGHDMNDIRLTTIGKYICFLSQEVFITMDNIKPIDDPLFNKIDDVSRLSVGERQKLMIMHYVSLKPDLMILDETFSNIDEDASFELIDMIFSKIPTVIIVTHRKSILKKFNKIYTLKNGTIEV